MRSFKVVKDPGFKAVIDEFLKVDKKYLHYCSAVFNKFRNYVSLGRELSHDTALSSDDIISCDRTI